MDPNDGALNISPPNAPEAVSDVDYVLDVDQDPDYDPEADLPDIPEEPPSQFAVALDKDIADLIIKAVENGQLPVDQTTALAKRVYWRILAVETQEQAIEALEELKKDYPFFGELLLTYGQPSDQEREANVMAKLRQFLDTQK
jgi:hypothetical protein